MAPQGKEKSTKNSNTIFFFHEHDPKTGIFSQWYPCNFKHNGIEFVCAEQWMMYHKALSASDHQTAQRVLDTASPERHKQLGKEVKGFSEKEWDKVKLAVVEQGNYLKFTQGDNRASMSRDGEQTPTPLKELLLATFSKELVEASRFDRVWGIGFTETEAKTTPRENWGQNLLGTALMNVRERLRREEAEETEAKYQES